MWSMRQGGDPIGKDASVHSDTRHTRMGMTTARRARTSDLRCDVHDVGHCQRMLHEQPRTARACWHKAGRRWSAACARGAKARAAVSAAVRTARSCAQPIAPICTAEVNGGVGVDPIQSKPVGV